MRSGFNILLWTLIVIVTALAWQVYQQGRTIKELVRLEEVQGEINQRILDRIKEMERWL